MEIIVITGEKNAGKSTIMFNIAFGLSIEGRSVGVMEMCGEKSYMAEIINRKEEEFKLPSKMQGIINLMVNKSEILSIEDLKEEKWDYPDYLLIEIEIEKFKENMDILSGKSIFIVDGYNENGYKKGLEIISKSRVKNIGIVENKVKEYRREVNSEYKIVSRIPFEEKMGMKEYDGIPYIYKNFNTKGIIELREIVDRIIDFEYGEEEKAVKKAVIGVGVDEEGKVSNGIDESKKILIIEVEGMLYKKIKEILKEKTGEENIDTVLYREGKLCDIEKIMEDYIEKLNKEKRHSCH